MTIKLTILGQPCSKSNRRRLVTIQDRPAFIKSKEALAYERDALRQIPPACRLMIMGPVKVTMHIFYETERPDLDPSVILDCLQARYKGKGADRVLTQRGVYVNDRQVRELHLYHGIDKKNPRAEIEVEPLEAQLFVMDADQPVGALHAVAEEEKEPF